MYQPPHSSRSTAATVAQLTRPVRLNDLNAADAAVLRQFRLAAMARLARTPASEGRDLLGNLARALGGYDTARTMYLIVEGVAALWPEAFQLARPCCPIVTADERVICQWARHAAAGDRAGFDQSTRDMLGATDLDFVYARFVELARL